MGGEHPEWLPADWEVRVKRQSSGKKDKYYIHPSTGLTFNSKPEVLRHLKGLKSSIKTPKQKEINKININKTLAENLPPGWIKEIRRKKTKGKIRTDTYYTDPISGRLFRSMQEVYRHLKSKDSVELESKPKDKGCTRMELVDHSPSSPAKAKGQRPIGKKGDKNMTDGERIKSGGTKYANCFICIEAGHLSKDCPKNTHGIYPKGGSCKICRGVTHLARHY
ncbi:uncharacterized protein LOC121782385 isoform X4 [Salvia splendens]|uniref:uncharacterized protein LOC121782385 isoform X4 n=1 Tax=Salvia splendens TaxID=180675 RepID=UPI001C279861|nr:uncharacterized protein LOC121782385 isoform X4 [Salvia splendens]